MYTYLKDREYYEERYDDATVAKCRSGERIVNDTFSMMEKKLPKKELTEKAPGWYLEYSKLYFWFAGLALPYTQTKFTREQARSAAPARNSALDLKEGTAIK